MVPPLEWRAAGTTPVGTKRIVVAVSPSLSCPTQLGGDATRRHATTIWCRCETRIARVPLSGSLEPGGSDLTAAA
jgi:hypothetical protein